ncbi:hypothetical protein [Bradyrhizobium sp. STM 3557]
MNLEQPALYAGNLGAWFGGLQSDAVYKTKRIGFWGLFDHWQPDSHAF